MKTTIQWDANYNGVHILTDTGLSLIVSGQPSMVMSWHDAVRFYKDNKVWQLPTREHLKLIAEHIDEVNALIKANGGYEVRGWHWTADEYDEFARGLSLCSMATPTTSISTSATMCAPCPLFKIRISSLKF